MAAPTIGNSGAAHAAYGSDTGSVSQAFNVGNGSNRVLYAFVFLKSTGATVSSCTYNSVALTSLVGPTDNTEVRGYLYRLINPAANSNTFAMSWAGGGRAAVVLISVDGGHQTTPEGTIVTGTPHTTTPSNSVSTASDDLVVDALGMGDLSGTPTLTAGQTQTDQGVIADGFSTGVRAGGQTAAGTGGSVAMGWTISAVLYAVQYSVPVHAVGGVVAENRRGFGRAIARGLQRGLSMVNVGGLWRPKDTRLVIPVGLDLQGA